MDIRRLFRTIIDEDTAISFLKHHDILHTDRQCRNGHSMKLTGNEWRCNKSSCNQKIGIRVETWLSGSRLEFEKIVHFIFCWAHKLTTIQFCEKQLNISHDSTVDWNNYMRAVCVWKLEQNNTTIGGPGMTTEIDESVYTRRKNNTGRILPPQWIFGGICRETKQAFIVAVPDRSESTLLPIIYQRISPGTIVTPSIIISDRWRAYNNIGNDERYKHLTVNHSQNFVDPETGAHTQTIERMWGLVKEGNKRRRGTDRNFINSYMAEYLWHSSLDGRDPFDEILRTIAEFHSL
jgi:hypothetical protein